MSDSVTAQAKGAAISGGGVLPFAPPDKMTLYKSYMPFVKNGGLFITTSKRYDLGAEVFVLVKMPGDTNDRMPAVGTVIWINRVGTVSKPAGIGVQFKDSVENNMVRDRIEAFLTGMSQDTPTFTM